MFWGKVKLCIVAEHISFLWVTISNATHYEIWYSNKSSQASECLLWILSKIAFRMPVHNTITLYTGPKPPCPSLLPIEKLFVASFIWEKS